MVGSGVRPYIPSNTNACEVHAMDKYFEPSPDRAMIDRAALIVALVQGRESATRTDYAHPKLGEIVKVLKDAVSEAAGASAKR